MSNLGKGILKIASGSEPWLFLGIFGVVSILVMPIPIVVIDALLAATICFALLLVVFAVRVKSPTEISTFPSVLLFLTVFRIATDVAVTRAVLVNGDAGQLVLAFGQFVAGGNVGIGLMVFLTITVVQFIVIAKGSERVAEVVARFTLDGLPGRQMSIDADLRNGAISEEQAVERRSELERETQFHGSMDGAVRFVKGDVIACLIIVFINLLGGIGVGVMSRGLDFGDAIDKYSILSIGGGLISQIGSVLTALAAALLTTRSSKDAKTDLGTTFVRQFSGYPSVLIVVGLGCFLIALVPGLPWFAFVACGLALIAYGIRQLKIRVKTGVGSLDGHVEDGASSHSPYQLFNARTLPDTAGPIRLVIHKDMAIPRVIDQIGKAFAALVDITFYETGIRIPVLEIAVLNHVPENSYQILLHGVERARGVFEGGASADGLVAAPLRPHIVGRAWNWSANAKSEAGNRESKDLAIMIGMHIDACALANLHRIPTVGDIRKLLCSGGKDYATMLSDLTRNVPLIQICGIIRRLILEGVPLHNSRSLMAGLVVADPSQKDDDTVVGLVRLTLKDSLCKRLAGDSDELPVIELGDSLSVELTEAADRGGGAAYAMLAPDRIESLREQLVQILHSFPLHAARPIIITGKELRATAASVLRTVNAHASVIAWEELSEDIAASSLGVLE